MTFTLQFALAHAEGETLKQRGDRPMTRKLVALGCAALALLMLSAAYNPADARRGGHGYSGHGSSGARAFHAGPRSYAGARFHPGARFAHRPHINRHLHRHRHIFVGVPFIYGGYTYYYGDCDWLRRRALYTDNGYWWDRYYACIYGD
jgi:hypothetical protein